MPKIDNGPPDYRKNLPPIVEQNYGKWEYHESPRPGVLKHVGPAGALYSVRCASPRLVCPSTPRDNLLQQHRHHASAALAAAATAQASRGGHPRAELGPSRRVSVVRRGELWVELRERISDGLRQDRAQLRIRVAEDPGRDRPSGAQRYAAQQHSCHSWALPETRRKVTR